MEFKSVYKAIETQIQQAVTTNKLPSCYVDVWRNQPARQENEHAFLLPAVFIEIKNFQRRCKDSGEYEVRLHVVVENYSDSHNNFHVGMQAEMQALALENIYGFLEKILALVTLWQCEIKLIQTDDSFNNMIKHTIELTYNA